MASGSSDCILHGHPALRLEVASLRRGAAPPPGLGIGKSELPGHDDNVI